MQKYEEVYEAPIYQGYGMTEASPHLTNTFETTEMQELPDEERYELGRKAGIPAPGAKIRLRDIDGDPVPHDGETPGEIHARSPWLTDGYVKRPEANEESFTDDGWFKTGDIGTIDEYGYLDIVDRLDDAIKSGGEWISSVELENNLIDAEGGRRGGRRLRAPREVAGATGRVRRPRGPVAGRGGAPGAPA